VTQSVSTRSGPILTPDLRLDRFGERALLVRVEAQPRAQTIAEALLAELVGSRLVDVVPGDRSVLIEFDGTEAGERAARRALSQVVAAIGDSGEDRALASRRTPRHRVIPVSYGGMDGPDLESTASLVGITPEDLIRLHSGRAYQVLFLGFAPGFAYLGDIAAEIVVARLASPRTETRAGSVAIAETYTGIYPAELPGGWRVIGWTPVVLFDPRADPPTYLEPGDTVRFEPVDPADVPRQPQRPVDWAG
jgi:KipI family sensor histidine kinase inhibitor